MTSPDIYKRFDLSKTVDHLLKHDWPSMIDLLNKEIRNSEGIQIKFTTDPEGRDAFRHHVKYIKILREINELLSFPSTFQAFIGKEEISDNMSILRPLIISLHNQGRLELADVENLIHKK